MKSFMDPSRASSSRSLERFLPGLTIVLAASLALRKMGDFDTWWHLAAGRWSVENAAVPVTDTLSFTVPDHAWVNMQWLFDVVCYLVYEVGGAELLGVLAAVCFTGSIAILSRNLSASLGAFATSAMLFWTLTIVYERFLIRPEMVSFIYVGLTILLLSKARDDSGARLWLLVPLMIAWANMHSLFIVGAYCIGCSMVSCVAARVPVMPAAWRDASDLGPVGMRRMLAWGGLALLATTANPYLLDGALFPLELLTRIDGSNNAFQVIGEFRRPFSGYFPTLVIGSYQAFFFFSCATVSVAALLSAFPRFVESRRAEVPVRFDLAGLLIFAGMAALSLTARRNTAIFVIASAPFVAQCMAVVKAKLPRGASSAGSNGTMVKLAGRVVAVSAAAGLVLCVALVATNRFYRWDDQTQEFGIGIFEHNFPIHAAEFAREIGIRPNVYNDLTAGGYLSWARPAGEGVFIDGRLEVYDAEFFSEYTSGLANLTLWYQQAEDFGINSAILFHRWGNRHSLIASLARSSSWSLVYYDEVAVVFVRTQGSDDVIAAARAKFKERSGEVRKRLAGGDSSAQSSSYSSWQHPVGRAVAAVSFAGLLDTLGQGEAAAEYHRLALDIGLSKRSELGALLRLSSYYLRSGQNNQARIYLRRALTLDPDNERVRGALDRLGS